MLLKESTNELIKIINEELELDPKSIIALSFIHENGRFGSVMASGRIFIPNECTNSDLCKPLFDDLMKKTNLNTEEIFIDCDGIFDLTDIHANSNIDVRCGLRNKDGFNLILADLSLEKHARVIEDRIERIVSERIREETLTIAKNLK